MSYSNAFLQGQTAFYNNQSRDKNPYPKHETKNWIDWDSGWVNEYKFTFGCYP